MHESERGIGGISSFNLLAQSRVRKTKLSRTVSSCVLRMSKDGDCTTSLDSVSVCNHSHSKVKNKFLYSDRILCFTWCPVPLVFSMGMNEKSLNVSSLHPAIYKYRKVFPWLFSSSGSLHVRNPCRLPPVSPYPCCIRVPGPGTPGVALQMLSRQEGSPPWICWQHSC